MTNARRTKASCSRARKRRNCTKLPDDNAKRVPDLMEEIEVLWSLNDSVVWWKAEVIEIDKSAASSDSFTTATATIRYAPRSKYTAEDYMVSFKQSTSGQKLLRHISPSTPGFVTWKYPEEAIPIAANQFLSRTTPGITKKRLAMTAPHAHPPPSNNSVTGSLQRSLDRVARETTRLSSSTHSGSRFHAGQERRPSSSELDHVVN